MLKVGTAVVYFLFSPNLFGHFRVIQHVLQFGSLSGERIPGESSGNCSILHRIKENSKIYMGYLLVYYANTLHKQSSFCAVYISKRKNDDLTQSLGVSEKRGREELLPSRIRGGKSTCAFAASPVPYASDCGQQDTIFTGMYFECTDVVVINNLGPNSVLLLLRLPFFLQAFRNELPRRLRNRRHVSFNFVFS